MSDTVYRVIAITADSVIKERITTSEAKAIETCERWGRVPIFVRVGYMPSHPVEWDHASIVRTKEVKI